ncbi:hypothetical protein PHYSODRAFT_470722 [Phytophthora sojae]|uniref:Uncharacterized protein n=1 Tax=Phytophthora sojae (strain P6497) TaxID=1094619 RepID=G4YFU9_PHYSP|nr:hypothetical protein PHYSODRAFT_470722 [Phytophthora sojae]EGZ27676.1 hypothetical protein PHYSODRAFT_470722 [Phytophthora sojae]|eukprot:XP_009514951.1 hypothetical protein PHYSODRAFT_470722 [Phytophthora sojae]
MTCLSQTAYIERLTEKLGLAFARRSARHRFTTSPRNRLRRTKTKSTILLCRTERSSAPCSISWPTLGPDMVNVVRTLGRYSGVYTTHNYSRQSVLLAT